MEVKNKKEITYSISDIKKLIEQHILDNDLSSKGDAYKMEFIVEGESVFDHTNTDGWTDYKFKGVKVTMEIKE